MTTNQCIVDRAWEVVRGELRSTLSEAGMCLAPVRVVIEAALSLPSHAWDRWRTRPVERVGTSVPWARDMERSLCAAGEEIACERLGPPADLSREVDMERASLVPSDLLRRWDVAPDRSDELIGHVGVLLDHGLVLEHIAARHGKEISRTWRGPTRVGPLGEWPVTSVTRVHPRVEPAA